MEEMSEVDAWEYEYKIKTILGRLIYITLTSTLAPYQAGKRNVWL
jgi:ATP-binding cassette subfamily F protein uup